MYIILIKTINGIYEFAGHTNRNVNYQLMAFANHVMHLKEMYNTFMENFKKQQTA